MKLLDVMKKYDRCVVRESAKLTKIYNLLLKESEDADNIEEAEVCPDCGEDPCVCESGKEVDTTKEVNEDDSNVMTAEEFFAEAEKAAEETNECGESEEATSETEEADDIGEAEKDIDEEEEKEETDADEDEKKANDDIGEAEEMMSAEEFFAEAETDADEDEKKANDDIGEAEKDIDEEEEEKKLEESLKSYRRANHRLFNN